MTAKLTRKQEAFVLEYLKDNNGQKAAERAGYSPKYARSVASRLLKKSTIINMLDRELEALKMDKDEALRLLAEMAREADSESVRERAIEKVIDVHLKGEGVSDIVLRVVREHDNTRSPNNTEDSPPETTTDSDQQGEA